MNYGKIDNMEKSINLKRWFRLSLSLILFIGCANIFEPAGDKNSDEALYEEAQKYVNDSDYDSAIEKFEAISATFLAQEEVRKAYAGALAGKCGLNFLEYFNSLSGASSVIFKWFMNAFTDKVIDPDSCAEAQAQMELLSESKGSLDDGEKLFMAILGMVKIGTNMRHKADVDGASNLGDGSMDAGFNVCANVNDTSHFTDDEMKQIITGFGLVLLNISTLGSNGNNLGDVSDACDDITPNPCEITDVDSVTADSIDFFRNLIDSTTYGIGSCANTGALILTCCP